MKKKSPAGVLISGFLKSLCVILLFVLTFFISYKVSYYIQETKGSSYDEVTDKIVSTIADQDQKEPEVLRNVIYGVDELSGRIQAVVIENLDTKNETLDYRTVSTTRKLKLSNELYQKMLTVNEEVPQIVPLEDMMKYFQGSTIYEYANTILADQLGVDMTCYTTFSMEEFERIFVYQDGGFQFTDDFTETMERLTDRDSIREYIYEIYSIASSNFSRSMKCRYIDDYLKMDESTIRFTEGESES